jgi:hypothetical protein
VTKKVVGVFVHFVRLHRFNSWAFWYDVNRDNTEETFQNKRESAHFNSKEWVETCWHHGVTKVVKVFASMGQGNIFSGFINNRAENMIDRLEKQGQLRQHHLRNYCFLFAQDSFLADTNTVCLMVL